MKNKEVEEANNNVRKMSEELGLEYHPQDWGICNGSADRLEEFIAYFENGAGSLTNPQKFELFELIISSFNEAVLEDKFTDERKALLQTLITKYSDNELYLFVLNYWKGLTNIEEMPIGQYL